MINLTFRGALIASTLLLAIGIEAQSEFYTPDLNNPVTIYVEGGSTLHDWTVTCPVVEGYPMTLALEREGNDLVMESFHFKVKVESMEGGRGAAMDKKTFTALKGEENPFIIFTQTVPFHIAGSADSITSGAVSGNLIIAGIERKVAVNVNVTLQDGALIFSGVHPLKMSDFQIDPPSAMFGQIQTHDDINIEFEFRYRKTDQ